MSAAGQTSHDLPSVQVHLCGGSQNRFHERASYPREGNQAAHELVRDQEIDGKLLGCPRRKKRSNNGMALSHVAGRAAKGKGATAIRELFQVRVRSQSMGPCCFTL